jgi:membrane protein YdbS with pleckstrin-like domain
MQAQKRRKLMWASMVASILIGIMGLVVIASAGIPWPPKIELVIGKIALGVAFVSLCIAGVGYWRSRISIDRVDVHVQEGLDTLDKRLQGLEGELKSLRKRGDNSEK